MRKLYMILFILLLPSQLLSQSFRTIHRAEKAIEQKKYDKALRLLDKAEKQDYSYGFCGTPAIEAASMIAKLRYRTYKEKDDKGELKKLLDETNLFFLYDNSYSKERLALALETYTKNEIENSIRHALENYKEDSESYYNTIIPVKISETDTLKLYFNFFKIYTLQKNDKSTLNDALIKYYEQSEYYTLLH